MLDFLNDITLLHLFLKTLNDVGKQFFLNFHLGPFVAAEQPKSTTTQQQNSLTIQQSNRTNSPIAQQPSYSKAVGYHEGILFF